MREGEREERRGESELFSVWPADFEAQSARLPAIAFDLKIECGGGQQTNAISSSPSLPPSPPQSLDRDLSPLISFNSLHTLSLSLSYVVTRVRKRDLIESLWLSPLPKISLLELLPFLLPFWVYPI